MSELTSNCKRGISKANRLNENQEILDKASYTGYYNDLYLNDAFCPPSIGTYQLIFDGSYEETNEQEWSSYLFNGILSKSSSSAYHSLYDKTCYKYLIVQAVALGQKTGSLYYKEINGEKTLITSDTSYTCEKFICLKGSKHPNCSKYFTSNNNICFPHCIFIFIFIIP